MKYNIVKELDKVACPPVISIIGRNGAGVPVNRIEAVLEFNSEAATQMFRKGLEDGRVVKLMLDENKIKSLIILDTGDIYPSTFHYTTIRRRCEPYITLVTIIGCDQGGININRVNLVINYKFDNSNDVVEDLLSRLTFQTIYDDVKRTKSLLITSTKRLYPCTFNYTTLCRRINHLNEEDVMEDEESIEDDYENFVFVDSK